MLPGVSHLPHTHDLTRNAFSKGEPEHGVDFADALEGLLTSVDPSTVAAVIVEPVAGAGGVLPPPKGYLKRLREITSKHGILLIFDEVVTGFGRLGAPFAAQASWRYTRPHHLREGDEQRRRSHGRRAGPSPCA